MKVAWIVCSAVIAVAMVGTRAEAAQKQRQRQIEEGPAAKQRAKQKQKEPKTRQRARDDRIIDTSGRVLSKAVIANENRKKQILAETMDWERRQAARSGDQRRWDRTIADQRKRLRAAGLGGL